MYKCLILVGLLSFVNCDEARKHRVEDPLASLDRHLTHTLAYHYLWPWSQLMKAAAVLDTEDYLEEPQIFSDSKRYEIKLNVKRFKPDELKVIVKNRYIIVEGKHKVTNDDTRFIANHFVQRFVLPPGSKQEEVKAVLNEKGVLSISGPKHELPPPPPVREIPIEVLVPEKTTQKTELPEKNEDTTEKKDVPAVATSTGTSFEQLELTEATTHVGKIRKKELKTTPKTSKDNEVTKGGEGNGLDYALIEADE
ncbi:unnamed protein product [Diatraea saccharalis]|uniref:SHSP domain-containing protein n=1 Tax=Diatraea saccharalis TaxID=40085 RepID=A0A9N9RG61_9NEOP|nr:unnamed protein product [Diatraea saccharalis]